tara:strand:+ start:413 stop:565 length:153 start_codon:yes stop_codon:yes gene_type:complete
MKRTKNNRMFPKGIKLCINITGNAGICKNERRDISRKKLPNGIAADHGSI